MENTFTTDIDAPPAKVFKWVYDSECNRQWLPNIVEVTVLEVKEGGVGSTFRQVYEEHGRRMEMEGTVVAYEQNRHLACDIRGSAFDLHVNYHLEDCGGRTRLTQQSAVRFRNIAMKIMGMLIKPLMRRMSARQSEAAFNRLKQCVAADPS